MTETTGQYIPQAVLAAYRGQAWKVWMGGTALVALFVLTIVIVPLLKTSGMSVIAAPIFHFFSYICHQMPERSFYIAGEQLAVCSRCFGVYLGLLTGFISYPFWRPIDEIEPLPRFWLFLALIPIGVDWSLTFFGIWENTHFTRLLTGLILGFTCATYIVPASVEITRNISNSGQRQLVQ